MLKNLCKDCQMMTDGFSLCNETKQQTTCKNHIPKQWFRNSKTIPVSNIHVNNYIEPIIVNPMLEVING